MRKRVYPRALAELESSRAVDLLPNSHVELYWDWTVIEMRTADLIVLHQTIRDWLEQGDIDHEHYSLQINQFRLSLSATDLQELHSLLQESFEELPRQIVRWVDSKITISPIGSRVLPASHFSIN